MRILRWLALALAPLVLWASPAAAQYVVKDGNGVERTFCSITVLGVHYGCQVLHGTNGGVPQALILDGSGRPTVLQGGSWSVGITGTLPAFAATPTVDLGDLGGAASEVKQDTAIGHLAAIEAAAEDPTPVPIASDSEGTPGSAKPSKAAYVGAQSGSAMVGLIQAGGQAAVNISTITTTEIVALQSGQKIYVTYAHVESAGTTTFKFVYGTGTNCGTGTTDLHPAFSWQARDGFSGGSGLGPILVVPAGNALCVTNSATVQVSGWVAFTQF